MARTIGQLEKITGRHTRRPASDIKARWREIVDEANTYGEVIVTNHNRPEVVVLSVDHYAKLKSDAVTHDPLAALRDDFDRELAVLRGNQASRRLRDAFSSTPAALARAANKTARKPRR